MRFEDIPEMPLASVPAGKFKAYRSRVSPEVVFAAQSHVVVETEEGPRVVGLAVRKIVEERGDYSIEEIAEIQEELEARLLSEFETCRSAGTLKCADLGSDEEKVGGSTYTFSEIRWKANDDAS